MKQDNKCVAVFYRGCYFKNEGYQYATGKFNENILEIFSNFF